jgi:hypothetical protein
MVALLAMMAVVNVPALISPAAVSAATGYNWSSEVCSPGSTTTGACQLPAAPGLGNDITINSVSCTSATSCVAVGYYADNTTPTNCPAGTMDDCSLPVIETLSGTTWTTTYGSSIPLPADPTPGIPAYTSVILTGVSCVSTTFCVAVGNMTPYIISESGYNQYPLAEVFNGSSWTLVGPFPNPYCLANTVFASTPCSGTGPSGQPGGTIVSLGAISCSSTTSCVAVGSDTQSPGYQGVEYSFSGDPTVAANWSSQAFLAGPADSGTTPPTPTTQYGVVYSGISCTATTTCVAVGNYTDENDHVRSLATELSGTAWTDISPATPQVAYAATLTGVSCQTIVSASNATCQAVGTYDETTSDGSITQALAESLSGSAWSATVNLPSAIPALSGTENAGSGLESVSCSGVDICSAVGYYIDSNFYTHLLVETLSGNGWTPTTGIDPAGATDPDAVSVSCAGQGACFAVGDSDVSQSGGVVATVPFVALQTALPATELEVSAPGAVTAGKPFTVTVVACSGSTSPCTVANTYTGTIAFTSSSAGAVLPPDAQLINGQGTFSVTLDDPGSPETITATDTVDSSITGTSGPITVTSNVVYGHPGPVQNLSATGGTADVVLTWNAPSSNGGLKISDYEIRRGTAAGQEATTPIGTTTALTYTDVPPSPGTEYFYTVVAVNPDGSSPAVEVSAYRTGSLGGGHLFAGTPDGKGYWLASPAGAIFPYGDAVSYGNLLSYHLAQPIVSMASTPDGKGYWMVAGDGGIFAFGDARFYGSLGGIRLNQPIVAIGATGDGKGYWLAAADGGMFAFGDARFYGSLGGIHINKPIVGMAATPRGNGYWLVASDGGMFAFGDAGFFGSTGGQTLVDPIVGFAASPDGKGYWLVASDGGIFNYGDAKFFGSLGNVVIQWPILGMVTEPSGTGYSLINYVGAARHFGD